LHCVLSVSGITTLLARGQDAMYTDEISS
jgi:hypothetical protein